MNKRQKEVITSQLDDEKAILKSLEKNYATALADIKHNIKELQSNPLTQSKAYQLDFQKQLEKQLSGIVDNLQGKNFASIADYLNTCYNQSFIGTMYDLQGQGVPLVLPIYQKQMLKAVQKTGDDIKLVDKIGVSTSELKKHVLAEMQRGFATELSYTDIARNISNRGQANMNRSMLITRTEGHRVQSESKIDALYGAKAKGADVVKQWDSTLDGDTREAHGALDGQIRELDEPFEGGGQKAMYPGGFGDPAQDCNCRCCLLQRARWAVKNETSSQRWNNETGGFIECSGFADFKEKYLKASKELQSPVKSDIIKEKKAVNNGFKELSKKQYQKLVESQDIDYFDLLKIKNFNSGYTGTPNSFEINDALRNNSLKSLAKESRDTVKLLNQLIESNGLPQDIQVTRYLDAEFLKTISRNNNVKIGTIVTEKGFLSTSALSDVNVFTDRPVKMTLNAKKGTKAFITDNLEESEIIFKPGTKYQIVEVKENKKITELVVNILE